MLTLRRLRGWLASLGVVGWLVAANVACFLVVALGGAISGWTGHSPEWTRTWFALSSDLHTLLTHPWTLLTYMVTQYALLQLIFNVLWLVWFARVLLMTLSERHVLSLYIFGGLAGALLFLLFTNLAGQGSSGILLSGSSASVLAVMTAAAFRSPDYEIGLLFIGSVKLKWIALVCIVLSFCGLGGANTGGGMAHIGGVLFGGVAGYMLRRGVDILKHPNRLWERLATRRSKPRAYPGTTRGDGKRRADKVARAVKKHHDSRARLDELLDKIRLSGFDSLSRSEKRELEKLSKEQGGS